MDGLDGIIRRATEAIDDRYFTVNIDGGSPIYRERVYCYELYHRMRCLWPPRSPYDLNGELDKAGHAKFGKRVAGRPKPDLLVHRPGSMSHNHAIIEVKAYAESGAQVPRTEQIKTDLKKLCVFIDRVGYERAIYLVYGSGAAQRAVCKIREVAARVDGLVPIELWVHEAAGQRAMHDTTLQPTG